MKNITGCLLEQLYRRARITAVERDGSVSALMWEPLRRPSAEESDFAKGKRLQDEVRATIRRFRADDRLTRDALHRRRAGG